ncbi:phosphoesterase [Candidatus Woesearchaeota archaeon CG10_big_fil_rev_8_21_14_0_10_37_12]|nr:MAG: phosphoesterase [Candidatus Woesearchaeota archaeon CG10_big_fil_rev_8_21_14_0_10_37_12]
MPTRLTKDVFAVDVCTYLPEHKAVIIADIHLGFEERLKRQGVLVPRVQFKNIIKRLEWILKQVDVKRVILNGDIKEEFGGISDQEWREVKRLIEFFRKKKIKIIAVKGNHDTILGPLARKFDINEVKEVRFKDLLIAHGDEVPKKLEKTIIIGHEHPAIRLKDKQKVEKFKCFIKGKYKKSTLIVQPSMKTLQEGTDVLEGKFLSPLLSNVSDFEVFIVDDETHDVLAFGNVKDLKW